MTWDLGREVLVYPRVDSLTYEGMEDTASGYGTAVTEVAFLQELDSTHEVIQSGQLNVGDVRIFFRHDTIADSEGKVVDGSVSYKLVEVSTIKGMTNNEVLYVKAFGKKLPFR